MSEATSCPCDSDISTNGIVNNTTTVPTFKYICVNSLNIDRQRGWNVCHGTSDEQESRIICEAPECLEKTQILYGSTTSQLRSALKYPCMLKPNGQVLTVLKQCSYADDVNIGPLICSLTDVECPFPASFPSMTVSYVGTSLGDNATYSCVNGYNGFGSEVVTCQSNGSWSVVELECKVPCTTIEFRCGNGDCIAATSTCDGINDCFGGADENNCSCGEPIVNENVVVEPGLVSVGSSRKYTCLNGYVMYGPAFIICSFNYTWSSPGCFEVINIALKREATQSTNYQWNVGEAWRGVDGNLNVFHPFCVHTAEGDPDPWWQLDLGQMAVISAIDVLNRDACYDRASQLYFNVGEVAGHWSLCGYFQGPGYTGEFFHVVCDQPMDGRYIRITGGGSGLCGDGIFMQFCEVHVLGFYPDPIPCSGLEFECPSKLCIPDIAVCDNNNDCGDDTDEADCPCPYESNFVCDNGPCIKASWECDGYGDCSDMSDEQDCPNLFCVNQYQCPDGGCIPYFWFCDQYYDCPYSDDESPDRYSW